ncbi:M13 family metallopeptidase [soil metagenome]
MRISFAMRGLIALGALIAASASALGAQATAHPNAIDPANMDTTCGACTDFFRFANGGWLSRTKIPAAYASYGSFYELNDRNVDVLHDIAETDAAAVRAGKAPKRSAAYKVGAFYGSCMDTAAIDRRGASPLKPELDMIGAIRTRTDLIRALGALELRAGLAPWGDGAVQDSKDAARTIAGLYQGGLTLPTKEYYTKTDSLSAGIRVKFTAHVTRIFQLLGDSPDRAAAEARTVLDVESKLARASKSPVELRDPVANYHPMTLVQLDSLTPHFEWGRFYSAIGVPKVARVDVGQPEFFQSFDTLLTTLPVEDWKSFLRWRAAHAAAPSLSTPFVQENFRFNQIFSGATELLPRWKRCVTNTDDKLGELLGQEFVKRTFPPQAKVRAVRIVDNLVTEFRLRIDGADWMTAPTKKEALVKLDAFARKIGYPDTWLDYSKVTIVPDSYFSNIRAADVWSSKRNWAKIGKPTNRTEWGMTPPTVNAYTNPLLNEIVFPAGILQPPFYDPKADDAVNYGAMGAVIGHEMSHEFDDQGRQYDKSGNLRDWWAKSDADRFVTEATKIEKQFDGYTVIDSATHVNGKLTLGENLGDFGGLTIAYSAMEHALGNRPRTMIDGFTPAQRFFLGWAQVWREVSRPESLRQQLNSNAHAPGEWRVNGPLSNMPEFRAAWGCKAGDPMVRADSLRPRIW